MPVRADSGQVHRVDGPSRPGKGAAGLRLFRFALCPGKDQSSARLHRCPARLHFGERDQSVNGISNLTAVDYAVVGASIAVLFLIGFIMGRKENSTHDFFLGGRKIPGWAACLSFVATEISAVTIISVPA